MTRYLKVKRLAHRVRKEILRLKLFYNSNGDHDLSGGCGLASLKLKKLLTKNKISSNIYGTKGRSHVWVETKDYLVDVTYSQFNHRNKVFIERKGTKSHLKFLKEMETRKPSSLKACESDYDWVQSHLKLLHQF
jgi:hypothetical protein